MRNDLPAGDIDCPVASVVKLYERIGPVDAVIHTELIDSYRFDVADLLNGSFIPLSALR